MLTVKVTVIEVISGVLGIAMIALRILYGDRNVWYVQSTNYGYDITVYHFIFNGCRCLFILQEVPCHHFLKL